MDSIISSFSVCTSFAGQLALAVTIVSTETGNSHHQKFQHAHATEAGTGSRTDSEAGTEAQTDSETLVVPLTPTQGSAKEGGLT